MSAFSDPPPLFFTFRSLCPWWRIGGGIRIVINNSGSRGSLFITRMAHFSDTYMWNEASHVCCAVVKFTATMRVQNYAGSQVKRVCCWQCSSGCQAICLHYSYNCYQHSNWYRALCGSLGDSWASCCYYCCCVLFACSVIFKKGKGFPYNTRYRVLGPELILGPDSQNILRQT